MNGDVEREAPRPRPLSAGIWTLFSWLRRTDRSSSSESVSSVGSDRTVASFDFLAPLNYKHANKPLVLPQDPLTETYKQRLHERNLRRQYDRDITLRRKYGLFREEGFGYDAFSLPSARRFQKDCVVRQDRERRATSESIQRRSAYVPGKRRAPLPPTIVSSATLPRNYKRKRPAPKPPVTISEENKENVEIHKISQMNTTSDVDKHLFLSKDVTSANKTEKHSKHEIKEVKLRTDKSFLKQIFDNKKRNSAIDTSRIKLLPSISELDKQAAEIIEANKALRASGHNDMSFDSRFRSASAEETWICTTCLRKYKPVVTCCIYCIIKESSNNKISKNVSTNASNTYTQTDENALKSSRKSGNDDKKKLRDMLKEMKDSLPKRPKHNDKYPRDNRHGIVKPTETPTLRIGSAIDENIKVSLNNSKTLEKEREPENLQNHAKDACLTSQPSSSNETHIKFATNNGAHINRKSDFESSSRNLNNSGNLFYNISTSKVRSEKESPERSKELLISKKFESHSSDSKIKQVNNNILSSDVKVINKIDTSPELQNINKCESSSLIYDSKVITNELLDNNVQLNDNKEANHQLKEIKGSVKIYSLTNSEKEAPTEIPASIEVSQILISNAKLPASSVNKDKVERIQLGNVYSSKIVNMDQTKTDDTSNNSNTKQPASSENKVERIQLGNVYKIANIHQTETSVTSNNSNTKLAASSKNKEKVERIQLGNVYSSKIVKIDQTETAVTSNNSGNINLQTPLKISSLLNPLYCPKYKTSNDKVSDCNFAKDLTPKATNLESNKKVEASLNQQRKLSNIVSTVSVNVQTPSSSNPKLVNEILQNSEANLNDTSKVKKCENVEDPKRKISDNTSLEVRTATPNIKILDHHDMRRNLVNQLEQAISKGDEQLAAEAAAKLAKLKLACSVLSFSSQIVAEAIPKTEVLQDNITHEENKAKSHVYQTSASSVKSDSRVPDKNKAIDEEKQQEIQNPTPRKKINILPEATASTSTQKPDDEIPIQVWVEDKEAARGPIPLRISRKARIGELKWHVETSLGLEIRLQRWIVGKTLCTDDNTPLVTLAGRDLSAPFYLCVVESETNKDIAPQIKDVTQSQIKTAPSEKNNAASGDVYKELMKLEQQALVPNTEEFECSVCIEQCAVGAGVVLRECIHTFCRECLVDVIRHCEEPVVACPAIQCPGALQEREIRAILSTEEYERWLARGLAAAESGTRNTFHCRTRDCKGWAFCEPEVRRFPCPVCKHTNCVPCQAVHEGETCEQYQEKLREAVSAAESDQTDEGTQALLKSLISRGEALQCPECSAIITKKWGCDWVKCSACKTEICWVTKGRRWGPGGKGDTSGGCRCGVDGKRCHPSCGYCH